MNDELMDYLSKEKYDADINEYILSTFQSLTDNYEKYLDTEPDVIDKETYINHYISIMGKINMIKFIRDINEHPDFFSRIITSPEPLPIGYKKGEDGKYYVSTSNPTLICSRVGQTDRLTKEIYILFDDITRSKGSNISATLIHELTHANQKGFKIPWYLLNRDLFFKSLLEGQAISRSRYISEPIDGLYGIPFLYDNNEKKFSSAKTNSYLIYRYIYFKLEFLLGREFMDNWATDSSDFTYFFKAQDTIDKKYGPSTFKRLYTDLELIFMSMKNYHDDEITEISNTQKIISDIYNGLGADSYEQIKTTCDHLYNVLSDIKLVEAEYQEEVKNYMDTFNALNKLNNGNLKLSNFTLDNYRKGLEDKYKNLRGKLEVVYNLDAFMDISNSNLAVCKKVAGGKDYLTKTIIDLEDLMLQCISKESQQYYEKGESYTKKYRYYINNVGLDNFSYGCLNKTRKMSEYLNYKIECDDLSLSNQSNLSNMNIK